MIKESIILPSQGYPYNGRLNGTSVTVRPLTTRVYKDFLVNPNEEGVIHLVDSCLVDCPISAEELVYQDELAVYLKIRSISMGSMLPIFSVCPKCKEKNTDEWDIMKLECSYLSLDEYPLTVTLPDAKKKIRLSMPTSRSEKLAKEEAQKRATRFEKKATEFLPSFKIATIMSVDGMNDLVERAEWYNSLSLKDAIYIDKVLDAMQDFGIHTDRLTTCSSCGHEYSVPLQINSDFFRPDVGNITGIKTAKGTLEEGPSDTTETK